jgi:hypothetical protein
MHSNNIVEEFENLERDLENNQNMTTSCRNDLKH